MSGDGVIRFATAAVVCAVASLAAVVCYSHIYGLGRARGQDGTAARLLPLITGDVKTLDHRCADLAQLIHDDRVPLLPAAEAPPTSPAERPGSHRRPASALPLSDASAEHDGTP